jgi:hypothetical protein
MHAVGAQRARQFRVTVDQRGRSAGMGEPDRFGGEGLCCGIENGFADLQHQALVCAGTTDGVKLRRVADLPGMRDGHAAGQAQ